MLSHTISLCRSLIFIGAGSSAWIDLSPTSHKCSIGFMLDELVDCTIHQKYPKCSSNQFWTTPNDMVPYPTGITHCCCDKWNLWMGAFYLKAVHRKYHWSMTWWTYPTWVWNFNQTTLYFVNNQSSWFRVVCAINPSSGWIITRQNHSTC